MAEANIQAHPIREFGSNKCPYHFGQEVIYACEDCRELACVKCVTSSHRGHVFDDLRESMPEVNRNIQNCVTKVEQTSIPHLTEKLKTVNNDVLKEEQYHKDQVEKIQEKHRSLRNELDNINTKFVKMLKDIEQHNVDALRFHEKAIRAKLHELRSKLDELRETFRSGSNVLKYDAAKNIPMILEEILSPIIQRKIFVDNESSAAQLQKLYEEMLIDSYRQTPPPAAKGGLEDNEKHNVNVLLRQKHEIQNQLEMRSKLDKLQETLRSGSTVMKYDFAKRMPSRLKKIAPKTYQKNGQGAPWGQPLSYPQGHGQAPTTGENQQEAEGGRPEGAQQVPPNMQQFPQGFYPGYSPMWNAYSMPPGNYMNPGDQPPYFGRPKWHSENIQEGQGAKWGQGQYYQNVEHTRYGQPLSYPQGHGQAPSTGENQQEAEGGGPDGAQQVPPNMQQFPQVFYPGYPPMWNAYSMPPGNYMNLGEQPPYFGRPKWHSENIQEGADPREGYSSTTLEEDQKRKLAYLNKRKPSADDSSSESDEDSDTDEEKPSGMIKVTKIPPKVSEDTLTFFFENRRKNGVGAVEEMDFNEADRTAIITFDDPAAVDRIIQKLPILLDGVQIGVERFVPDNFYDENVAEEKPSSTIKVKGADPREGYSSTTIEEDQKRKLAYLNKRKPSVDDSSSESDEDSDTDEEKPSGMIKVTKIPSKVSEDTLTFFFENRRKSGGGDIEEMDFNEANRTAIITFEDPAAVDRIMQKLPILLDGVQIGVERFVPDNFYDENVAEEKPSCTIKVEGVKKSTYSDTVWYYFESKRAAGVPIDVENFEDKMEGEDERVFYVTFTCEEDKRKVLSRQHKVDGKILTVTEYIPPTP